MWITSILMAAILASTEQYSSSEDRLKELHSRLGLGLMPYPGMPFVGGLPVLEFADGSQIVRLLTKEDFDIAGASLDNYRMTKGDYRSKTPILRELSDSGGALIFIYRNRDKVPEFMIKLDNQGQDAPGQWNTGNYSREVVLASHLESHLTTALPDALADKLLAFWLDLGSFLVESVAVRTARALGEGRQQFTLKKRTADLPRPNEETVCDWREQYYIRRYYEEEGDETEYLYQPDTGEENEDYEDYQTALDVTSRSEIAFEREADELMLAYENLDLFNVPLLRGKMTVKGKRAIHGRSEWAWQRFERSWEIEDRTSAEFLLDTWSYELILVRREPNMNWMREHLIRNKEGLLPFGFRRFDKLLVYWKLTNRAGQRIGKLVPYAEGPWSLLNEALGISTAATEEEVVLREDAAAVASETQRTWLIPVEEAMTETSVLMQSRR